MNLKKWVEEIKGLLLEQSSEDGDDFDCTMHRDGQFSFTKISLEDGPRSPRAIRCKNTACAV